MVNLHEAAFRTRSTTAVWRLVLSSAYLMQWLMTCASVSIQYQLPLPFLSQPVWLWPLRGRSWGSSWYHLSQNAVKRCQKLVVRTLKHTIWHITSAGVQRHSVIFIQSFASTTIYFYIRQKSSLKFHHRCGYLNNSLILWIMLTYVILIHSLSRPAIYWVFVELSSLSLSLCRTPSVTQRKASHNSHTSRDSSFFNRREIY
jgi:hypothetical protein